MWGGGWSEGGGCLIARFGVGGDMGYGGCEPRIEGIVHLTKFLIGHFSNSFFSDQALIISKGIFAYICVF